MMALVTRIPAPGTRIDWIARIQAALDAIFENLDRAVPLAELADEAGFSPYHFHRVFRSLVGEAPAELARRLRIERAAYILGESGSPVGETALDAGFESPEAFARAFRDAYGVPPSRFGLAKRDHRLPTMSGVHWQPGGPPTRWSPTPTGVVQMEVRVVDMPHVRLACVRHTGPYHEIGEAFGKVWSLAAPAGLVGPNSRSIGIYHDDPGSVPPSELRSDACIIVEADEPRVTAVQGLTFHEGLDGHYAVATYKGPYHGLGAAWTEFLRDYLPQSGLEIRDGQCFELYLNDPYDTPEDELVTEIAMPVV